jgi:hypothetical protein
VENIATDIQFGITNSEPGSSRPSSEICKWL